MQTANPAFNPIFAYGFTPEQRIYINKRWMIPINYLFGKLILQELSQLSVYKELDVMSIFVYPNILIYE